MQNGQILRQKTKCIYIPLPQAFMDEIKRSYKSDQNMPRKMVEYLISIKDYYKIKVMTINVLL